MDIVDGNAIRLLVNYDYSNRKQILFWGAATFSARRPGEGRDNSEAIRNKAANQLNVAA